MGQIAAGVPIEAINHMPALRRRCPVGCWPDRANHYALEVKGDSMIDAGINDGDVVVIRETSVAMTVILLWPWSKTAKPR